MKRRCSNLGERSWERSYSDEGEGEKRAERSQPAAAAYLSLHLQSVTT